MDCLYHKWLDTSNKTGNPIKLIFGVLNYARKTKYPRLRSAFTYIDEEQPSRLDFGKHKFGGPFTEEEVEDVKTVFRIIPLLVIMLGPLFEIYAQFGLNGIPSTTELFRCIHDLKLAISYVTYLVLIPAYRFILYPLFGKCIPSMLKMAGVGLFLCLVSTLISLGINSIGQLQNNVSNCSVLDDNTVIDFIPVYCMVVIYAINGVGTIILMCSQFEFIMAQSPDRMRGIMTGLCLSIFGIGALGNNLLITILQLFPTAKPSCVFYYHLVLSVLMLITLVAYVVIAKRYKLRERGKHINIQAIVEEHYERYIDQEEAYLKEIVEED